MHFGEFVLPGISSALLDCGELSLRKPRSVALSGSNWNIINKGVKLQFLARGGGLLGGWLAPARSFCRPFAPGVLTQGPRSSTGSRPGGSASAARALAFLRARILKQRRACGAPCHKQHSDGCYAASHWETPLAAMRPNAGNPLCVLQGVMRLGHPGRWCGLRQLARACGVPAITRTTGRGRFGRALGLLEA